MITAYFHQDGSFKKTIVSGLGTRPVVADVPAAEVLPSRMQAAADHAAETLPPDAIWVDLLEPTGAEIHAIEAAFGIEVPTREEMHEIEASSRLYDEGDSLVMTAPILHKAATEYPESGAVTFILTPSSLITVRFVDPLPFAVFARRALRHAHLASGPQQILLGLLEGIADRLADVLELAAADMEQVSRDIFAKQAQATSQRRPRRGVAGQKGGSLQDVLRRIGRNGDLATKARESLLGLSRVVLFLNAQNNMKKDAKQRIKTLSRDIASIADHATFLAGKINFLLDATLGLINIEQNAIIKIFTVAAVAFLPPTLIASIYGMNFEFMPELHWQHGYLLAIGMMVLSAVLPFWYFRKRGWL
ncbi:magnesium transporter CorA family protein [Dongia sp.]|uniref:magnesium transporter CorA family protein n=1 Tax=Dongia sp. TaxID=1977262 RepID=UPI0035B0A3A3